MKNYIFFMVSLTFLFSAVDVSGQPTVNPHCLSAIEFSEKIKSTENAVIIDVRTPEEFCEGHVPNAINIDWLGNDFDSQVKKLDTLKPVFVYCLSGHRSAHAIARMLSLGFKEIYELDGGLLKWQDAKLPESTIN